MPPDTLLGLPKNQVKRQEVISGECNPELLTTARGASQYWLRQSPRACESSCFPQRQLDARAVEQPQYNK